MAYCFARMYSNDLGAGGLGEPLGGRGRMAELHALWSRVLETHGLAALRQQPMGVPASSLFSQAAAAAAGRLDSRTHAQASELPGAVVMCIYACARMGNKSSGEFMRQVRAACVCVRVCVRVCGGVFVGDVSVGDEGSVEFMEEVRSSC